MEGENPFADFFVAAGMEGSGEDPVEPLAEAALPTLKPVVLSYEKRRGNKVVTMVRDVPVDRQEELLKTLKKVLGAGGALVDGFLVMQGDHRAGLTAWFEKQGVKVRGERG